ncbi:MAG: hypothetical protein JXQ73_16060 [Phycisphaerae bacterium]|nr:hypothetical protein [Phycisphaerae bacterium]
MPRPSESWYFGGCLLVVALCADLTSVTAAEESLPGKPFDKGLFPKAYGILADEHRMFPVDMGDWPVKIDRSRQLFVDDYLLAKTERITREVHHPRKHPANPLVRPDKPWDSGGTVFQIVRRDAKTGKFRMWYSGYVRYELPSGVATRFPTLYAESDDGIKWTKPELGLCEFEGSKANNIVIQGGNPFGLIVEPNDPDPNRRYKAVVWHEPQVVPREGYFLYTSLDGVHWKRAREAPLAISLRGYTMPQSGIGDTSVFRWDRLLGRYVGDVKFVLPGKFRCRGIMFSDDLIHWSPPRMTLYPDGLDEPDSQVYGHLSFCYEGMWLGFLRMMHTQRVGYKQTTVELTASRDGSHWTRVGKREELIPLGGREEWDADYHDPCWDPILVGDDLWIYYRSVNRRPDDKNPKIGHAIGLAVLRRDGFVSLNAGDEPGMIVTRPLNAPGKSLFVNAEVADGGWLKAAVLTPDHKPLPSSSVDDAVAVTTGTTATRVTWRNAKELSVPDAGHVRLVFQLKRAKLYSFWIE